MDDSIDHPGLQAADLIAYEAHLYLAEAVYGKDRSDRELWPGGLPLFLERNKAGASALQLFHYDADLLRFTADSFEAQRR